MSDYEDEMDVDAPVADSSITFGGDLKKGKRTAANLPVEAEDSLPWFVRSMGYSICNETYLPAGWRSTGRIH
jgi:hypothetical protein